MGPNLWQLLGKEDTFPVFCVLIMVSGVLAYLLAVYQIFLGLEEDKVVTLSGEEAGEEGQPEEKEKENQSKESIKLKGKGAKHGEVGSDSEEGSSSDQRVSGNFESGQERGLEINVEIYIPGFVMEKSQNKKSGAEHNRIRNKGMMTYMGFSARDSVSMLGGLKEAGSGNAIPEIACSRNWHP